jgi:predicted dehydrogenase
VDAVYVATPVSSHVPQATIALRAGCHVLVEKPVSPGLEPPEPLRDLAASQGLQVGVAYYRRLSPALQRVRALVSSGLLGTLRGAEIRFRSHFDPAPDDPKIWRTERGVSGGGVLADAGCHRLDLLSWLWGPPDTVEARLSGFYPGGAERFAELELAWADGARAHCTFEWAPEPRDLFRLTLERGELVLDSLDRGALSWHGPDSRREERHLVVDNPHRVLIEDFARAVAGGGPPVCPLEEGIATDHLIEAAFRSHVRQRAERAKSERG